MSMVRFTFFGSDGMPLLGAPSLGAPPSFVDIQQITRKVYAIKPLTYGVARSLLASAMGMIDRAIALAPSGFFVPPQNTARQNVKGHLDWHARNMGDGPADAPYPSADDLKKWAIQAYIEFNAATEGQYQQERNTAFAAVGSLLDDLAIRAKRAAQFVVETGKVYAKKVVENVSKRAEKAAKEAASEAVSKAAKEMLPDVIKAAKSVVPPWAIWLSVAASVATIGFILVKIAGSGSDQR